MCKISNLHHPRSMFHIFAALMLVFGGSTSGITNAASTTKSLSTNVTLVNLGSSQANVVVNYLKDNGSAWTADPANTTFTIPANGGQKSFAQYFDNTLSAGRGSAIISSDQPLGSLIQIQARPPQIPSTDAYVGNSSPTSTYYLPLVIRRGVSASGNTNSQIIIQNADTSDANVQVSFSASSGTPSTFSKTFTGIAPGVSIYYDLDDETGLSGTPWLGSAIVNSTNSKKISVVVNLFLGSDGLQTYSGFASPGTSWFIPQFTSRLTNGLSTPISGQNLSGSTIAANSVQLACNSSISTPSTFTMTIASSIANNAGFSFNPVVDNSFPNNWSGACQLTSPSNVVVFVQMRQIGTSNNGTYGAISSSSTDTIAFCPLISKRQANGFATVVTLQNLSLAQTANITLTFTPSSSYTGSQTPLTTTIQLTPGSSIVLNQRLSGFSVGSTAMPDGWFGTLTADSDQPLGGFSQITNVLNPAGDTFGAYNLFTSP